MQRRVGMTTSSQSAFDRNIFGLIVVQDDDILDMPERDFPLTYLHVRFIMESLYTQPNCSIITVSFLTNFLIKSEESVCNFYSTNKPPI